MAPAKKHKSIKRRKASRSTGHSHPRPLIATRILNGLLTHNFPFLIKPLLEFDHGVQKQMVFLRKLLDERTQDLRIQTEKMLLEIAQRVRKNLHKDLKKIEAALRDLATRVSKLERNIKKL